MQSVVLQKVASVEKGITWFWVQVWWAGVTEGGEELKTGIHWKLTMKLLPPHLSLSHSVDRPFCIYPQGKTQGSLLKKWTLCFKAGPKADVFQSLSFGGSPGKSHLLDHILPANMTHTHTHTHTQILPSAFLLDWKVDLKGNRNNSVNIRDLKTHLHEYLQKFYKT